MDITEIAAALAEQQQPKVVRRTWRERLFSLPWKPWKPMKMVWAPREPDALTTAMVKALHDQMRQAQQVRPTSAPCLHCAVKGAIELWWHTYMPDAARVEREFPTWMAINETMKELEGEWAAPMCAQAREH